MPHIDYYATALSPWAYLGHAAFLEVAAKHEATVTLKPISLQRVFPETGGVPIGQRHPARLAMRMVELQRWRDRRGVPLNLEPKHFPTNPARADRMAIAASEDDQNTALHLMHAFLAAVWAHDQDLTDDAVLLACAAQCGLDGAALLARAEIPDIEARYEANCRDAVSAGVVGSPAYVLNGEAFWGQDRIDLLEDTLRSRRSAYTA